MSIKINKGQKEKRDFAFVSLSNKLRCVLISDMESSLCAASLTVQKGSLNDPHNINGLAHLLEHSLFFGSEKYPESNDFIDFIQTNGGESNAITEGHSTQFYFSISNDKFQIALDKFSQFFICPNLLSKSIDNSINIINSEYSMIMNNTNVRVNQLVLNESSIDSKFHKFQIGNISSLKLDGIRDYLLNFYQSHYSSNLMNLAIICNQDLDSMKKLVEQYFSKIKNKDLMIDDYSKPDPYIKCSKFFKMYSNTDNDRIIVYWKVPCTCKFYQSNPWKYLQFVLDFEGEKSLFNLLSKKEFISRKKSSKECFGDVFDFIIIDLTLTLKGLEQWKELLKIFFGYFQILKSILPLKHIFDEIFQRDKIKFEFRAGKNMIDIVKNLSSKMFLFPDEAMNNILEGISCIKEYNPSVISLLINSVNENNLFIFLISKTFENKLKEKEVWYHTSYEKEEFNSELLEIINFKNLELKDYFELIPKCKYSLSNIQIIPMPKNISKFPELKKKTDNYILWWMADDKFYIPKAYILFSIYIKDFGFPFSIDSMCMEMIYMIFIFQVFKEYIFSAKRGGVKIVNDSFPEPTTILFYGFSSSIKIICKKFINKMSKCRPENHKDKFETSILNVKNFFKSILVREPCVHCMIINFILIKSNFCGIENLINFLEKITFETFCHYYKFWIKKAKALWFIYGNLSLEDSIEIAEYAQEKLKFELGNEYDFSTSKLIKIPKKVIFKFENQVGNKNDINSCILFYFQGKKFSLKNLDNWANCKILFCIMESEIYNFFRVKRQIGYGIFVDFLQFNKVYGGRIIIQSDVYCPKKIEFYFDEFIDFFLSKLSTIKSDAVSNCIEGQIKKINQPILSFKQQFKEFSERFKNRDFNFNIDKKEKEINSLRKVNPSNLFRFANEFLIENFKRINYSIISSNHIEENKNKNKEQKNDYSSKILHNQSKIVNIKTETELKLYCQIYENSESF